ncbi:diacylglycerol kinase [Suttonella ornithocola]|nr:diacylglycerol kinase [Suttonella ornithocola]
MKSSSELEKYAQKMKGKKGLYRIRNAYFYSIDGLKAACSESGFRQLLVLHSILCLVAVLFIPNIAVKMLLIFASFFSLIVELINTAVEAAVDHTSLEKHPLAKRAKDVVSAAQFISLGLCALLWLIALIG